MYIVVRLVCLRFCYSQTVFRMLIPEIHQKFMEYFQFMPTDLQNKYFGMTNFT